MAWETGVQSQVKSYQRLKKWYLVSPIQFSMSTQFNCQKHFYFKLFSLVIVDDHSRGSLFDCYYTKLQGATPFPRLLPFTFDPYLIMLSAKQGDIKYHFLSLWYDLTRDWTPVSCTIGKKTVLIQFSISTDFVYPQLNVKTVLY